MQKIHRALLSASLLLIALPTIGTAETITVPPAYFNPNRECVGDECNAPQQPEVVCVGQDCLQQHDNPVVTCEGQNCLPPAANRVETCKGVGCTPEPNDY